MGFFNQRDEMTAQESIRRYGAYEIFRKSKYGEALDSQKNKKLTGGCIDLLETEDGVITVMAEANPDAKNGIDGAKIACEAFKFLVKCYQQIYLNDDRLIKKLTNESFSRQLEKLWAEMVFVHDEDEKIALAEKKDRRFFGLFGKRDDTELFEVSEKINVNNEPKIDDESKLNTEALSVTVEKIEGEAEKESPFEAQTESQTEAQFESQIKSESKAEIQEEAESNNTSDILKNYSATVSFVVFTREGYILATMGNGGFVLYNQYEKVNAFSKLDSVAYLGESMEISFNYEKIGREKFEGVLMTSCTLNSQMADLNTQVKYAMATEYAYNRTRVSPDGYEFTTKEGVKKNLYDTNKEQGILMVLIKDTTFRMSEEKEAEYRNQRLNKIKEEAEAERLKRIREKLEIAKDRSVYETYETNVYEGYENVKVFLARRQGRGHVDDKIPCQDYCLSEKVSRGIVLAVSDGVGSCPKSHFGSKFATEAVVKVANQADAGCDSEETYVERLLSTSFRKRIVTEWMNSVKEHIRTEKEGMIELKDIEKYAATLLFAIITDNYYVVGNLGDGQIVLFNETEGLKIRKHSPKEGSKTRSLVNLSGYGETFVVEKYRRSEFSSVMLSTDGMYDPLEKGTEFYKFAKEAKNRYLENNEPYQAFCYTVSGDVYKEIYSSNTDDDCTIALATDISFSEDNKSNRYSAISEKYKYTMAESIGDVSTYLSSDGSKEYTTIVCNRKVISPKIDGVKFFDILESYENDGKYFNTYALADGSSIDELYQYAKIAEQPEKDAPVASLPVLKIYEAILECIQILDASGYALDQDYAQHLMVYTDKNEIVLYPEAIIPKMQGKTYDNKKLLSLFETLYGKLVCEGDEYPFFKLDYLSLGMSKYLTKAVSGYIGAIRNVGGKLYFENFGSEVWYDMDDNVIRRGDRIPLCEGELFKIKRGFKTEVYSFVEKKSF